MEPTMNNSQVTEFFCEPCKLTLSGPNYTSHINGKKHKLQQERFDRNNDKFNKSIFVQDVTHFKPADIRNIFGSFGMIKKIVKNENQNFSIVTFVEEQSVASSLNAKIFIAGRKLRIKKYEDKGMKNQVKNESPKKNSDLAKKGSGLQNDTEKDNNNTDKKPETPLLPGQVGLQDLPVIIPEPAGCPVGLNVFEWQTRNFISQVELSFEMYRSLNDVITTVERVFGPVLPGCRVLVFGSCATTLAFRKSDVDLYIQCAGEQPADFVKRHGGLMYRCRQVQVLARVASARVPIIKFLHLPSGWLCDLNANSRLGVCNSRLIRFLISLDDRIRPLLMIIKYWAKVCLVTGSNHLLTTYSLVMLVVFYLQQDTPKILPPIALLMELADQKEYNLGWECSFCDVPQKLFTVFRPQQNNISLKELLIGFIKFYRDFDFMNVICPLLGRAIPVTDFQNPENLPEEMQQYKNKVKESSKLEFKTNVMLRVQDPFELNINTTRNVLDKTFFTFKKACSISYDVSQAVSEDLLLKSLFSIDKKSLQLEDSSFTFNIRLKKDATTKDEDIALLYELSIESTLLTMREIMKLKVEPDNKETLHKVQKLELSTDVHTSSNTSIGSEDLVYMCTCDGIVWRSRRKISKVINKLNLSLSPFERDASISKALYQPKDRIMSFKLIIDSLDKFKKNRNTLVVKICEPETKEKGQFNDIASYLKKQLSLLVSQSATFITQTRESQLSSVDEVKESLQHLFDLQLAKLPDLNSMLDNQECRSDAASSSTESVLESQKVLLKAITKENSCKTSESMVIESENDVVKTEPNENCSAMSVNSVGKSEPVENCSAMSVNNAVKTESDQNCSAMSVNNVGKTEPDENCSLMSLNNVVKTEPDEQCSATSVNNVGKTEPDENCSVMSLNKVGKTEPDENCSVMSLNNVVKTETDENCFAMSVNNFSNSEPEDNCSTMLVKKSANPFLTSIEKMALREVDDLEASKPNNAANENSLGIMNGSVTGNSNTANICPAKMDEGEEETKILNSKVNAKLDGAIKIPPTAIYSRSPKVYVQRSSRFRKSSYQENLHPNKMISEPTNRIQGSDREVKNLNPGNFEMNDFGQKQRSKSVNMHKLWYPTLFKAKK